MFGAITQSNPAILASISRTFFGGSPLGFYQFAAIYSVVSIFAYIIASIVVATLKREEEEE